ncbi:hypothetical protein [Erwinia sp. Leaf53]|uniref:hypothetical protein n=1 Tax=Erwinia sp. Leaf53 TaxID=1736225 RepID=UPI000A738DA8|nr:hypothetical protein [Erwinia sp. Leaf53]
MMKRLLYIGLATALSMMGIILSVVAPASLLASLVNVLLWVAFVYLCLSGTPLMKTMLPGGRLIQTLVTSVAGRFIGVSSPYGRWVIWLLVIVLLVSTGSLVSLVIYLITMVIARVLRLMFNDPVTTCRA